MGPEGFSVWATMAMGLHEFVGPWIFTPGVALMIAMWLVNNLPEKGDIEWWVKGRRIIGKSHPSSGRLNSGEKLWFWFIATFGVACIVTGVILAFPIDVGADPEHHAALQRDSRRLRATVDRLLDGSCVHRHHRLRGLAGSDDHRLRRRQLGEAAP